MKNTNAWKISRTINSLVTAPFLRHNIPNSFAWPQCMMDHFLAQLDFSGHQKTALIPHQIMVSCLPDNIRCHSVACCWDSNYPCANACLPTAWWFYDFLQTAPVGHSVYSGNLIRHRSSGLDQNSDLHVQTGSALWLMTTAGKRSGTHVHVNTHLPKDIQKNPHNDAQWRP